jgi:betaine-aldehyde dehydrogenase
MSGSVKAEVRTYKNYVNGQWVSSASGQTFAVYDPSTEEVIARVSAADTKDVDVAVKATRDAFDSGPWSKTTAQDRGRILFKLADKIRQNAASLADLESRNTGKPIVEAEYDIADVATCFEYYGGLATKILGHVNPVPANALSFTLREPMGVAAQIIPCWLHLYSEACGANAADRSGIRQLS